MGVLDSIIGTGAGTRALGQAATDIAEVFVENRTRRMERDFDVQEAALAQHRVEFGAIRPGVFDRLVNGLNRLPRPMLALGTLGLFIYAMVDPVGFAARMEGLAYVPQPLWWLLGAIVSFYFGARELHYARTPREQAPQRNISAWTAPDFNNDNIALREWSSTRSDTM